MMFYGNSSITYKVTIGNSTSKYFILNSVTVMIYSNKNVKYEIRGIDIGETYQGDNFSFNITFTASSNEKIDFSLKFDLFLIEKNVWTFPYTSSYQVLTTLYDVDYKIEVWWSRSRSGTSIGHGGLY